MKCRIAILLPLALALPVLVFGQGDARTQNDQIQQNISRLIQAASKLQTSWPWQGAIPEVDRVARYGKRAGPFLVGHLQFTKGMHFDDQGWDFHVEQQIELALCKIYKVTPESGKSIYGIRSFDEENETIKPFWQEKVASESLRSGEPAGAETRILSPHAGNRADPLLLLDAPASNSPALQ
jgi:hypothetical protein